jgi:hypothetical protein
VTSIGNYAFERCTALTDFIVSWVIPLNYSDWKMWSIFNGTPLNLATLHVSVGTKAAYEAAGGWKDFGTIVEY